MDKLQKKRDTSILTVLKDPVTSRLEFCEKAILLSVQILLLSLAKWCKSQHLRKESQNFSWTEFIISPITISLLHKKKFMND